MRKLLLLLLSVGMFIGLTSCSKEDDLGKEKIEDKAEKPEDKVEDKVVVDPQIENDRVLKTIMAHKWESNTGFPTELKIHTNKMWVQKVVNHAITQTQYELKPKPIGEGNIYCTKLGTVNEEKSIKYSLNPEGTILIVDLGGDLTFTIMKP